MTLADSRSTVSPQHHGEWRLPFDVVANIMAASDPLTISMLMKSCHDLYTEGPKHLLYNGVELNSGRRIILFANFMITDDPSRFAHLRKLDLSFQSLFNRHAETRLSDLLAHSSLSLETLVLRSAESVLGYSSNISASLSSALGRFTSLKHLVALRVNAVAATQIKSLPSRLESITIGFSNHRDPRENFDVFSVLKPFSDTLRAVLIDSEPSILAPSSVGDATSHIFPNVRTFGIVCYDSVPRLFRSPTFVHAFPNIVHLKLIPDSLSPEPGSSVQWMSRAVHLSSQRRKDGQASGLQPTGSTPSLGWSSLTECSGGLLMVDELGLNRPLSTLHLWQHVRTADLQTFRTVLDATRPRYLSLSTALSNVKEVFATLRTLQAQSPPRIDLSISLPWNFRRGQLSEADIQKLRSLESSFRPFPDGLTELNVVFPTPLSSHDAAKSVISQSLARFTAWASTAAPSVTLTWGLSVEGNCEWPDLGQGVADDDDADDDDFDDYEYDYDYDSDNLRNEFLEEDGDEYDSDQWRRWDY